MLIESCVAASLVVAVDQATKGMVLRRRVPSPTPERRFGPRIRIVSNAGMGFGLLRNSRLLPVVWGAVVLLLALAVVVIPELQARPAQIALGAAVGGAASNLVDMRLRNSVVDFIDLRIWPVFNPADCAIVCGAGFALWAVVSAHV